MLCHFAKIFYIIKFIEKSIYYHFFNEYHQLIFLFMIFFYNHIIVISFSFNIIYIKLKIEKMFFIFKLIKFTNNNFTFLLIYFHFLYINNF